MKNPSRRAARVRGFALIASLSLMVLIAVIALGMLSLSAISLRRSSSELAMAAARANARMALQLAIGELQKHLGPDARSTVRAETLVKDARVGLEMKMDDPRRWWLGVSHGDGKTLIGDHGGAVVWLVSGIEGDPLRNPPGGTVAMIARGSLDLAAHTGGAAVDAGRVPLGVGAAGLPGSFAWLVDDEGMKAQLAATREAVSNDAAETLGNGVIPGTHALDELPGLEGIGGISPIYQNVASVRDLPLAGAPATATKAKYFSFTARSHGVLADVRHGGLKKDLTVAFENPKVFDAVFPRSDVEKWLLVDKARLPSDLRQNGYIHWGILRDYYNLKRDIAIVSGVPVLDTHSLDKNNLLVPTTPHAMGMAGPHAATDRQQPYGPYPPPLGNLSATNLFNPLFPVLSRLQQNAWVEYLSGPPAKLRTRVQMWTSHYNPHNITLRVRGDQADRGPRVLHYPLVSFSVGNIVRRVDGLDRKAQAHVPYQALIGPGRSQVFGFKSDRGRGGEVDSQLYDAAVKDLTFESVYTDYFLKSPLSGTHDIQVEFHHKEPALMVGMDHSVVGNPDGNGDREVSQVFFTPVAWERVIAGPGQINTALVSGVAAPGTVPGISAPDRPGIRFSKSVPVAEMNRNTMFSHALSLRTTTENAGRLRPLADSNLRAVWNNPRWDHGLGLPALAGHASETLGRETERFVPMDVSEAPAGYTYWGAGRDPGDGSGRVVLFDVPRRDLVSLGQLQHAATGRFSYEPSYIIGNSYANPRIPLNDWKVQATDSFSTVGRGLGTWKISGGFNLYDSSHLVNEALWDSHVFTTIPQQNDNFGGGDVPPDYPALFAGTLLLPNPRFLPYVPAGSAFDAATLRDAGNARSGSFFHNAGHLLVDGAFNVNSTSADAWEAFLSGTRGLPVARCDAKGKLIGFRPVAEVRYPRCQTSPGDGNQRENLDDSFWDGFRELGKDEVRQLAEAIVEEIRERGPFHNLADFINRRLVDSEAGRSGPLQAALDRTVNEDLDRSFEAGADRSTFANIPEHGTQGAGFPGQLLQGDVLQALSPFMTTRSDTFRIRAYGEARTADGNKVTARAWCEAVVQRLPDPLPAADDGGASMLEQLAMPRGRFGRRFELQSFRWLNPAEV